jgi:uncharacterized protein
MEIIGQQVIAAPRATVWKALNDPAVLKACLPGCESVEQASPEEFRVVIKTVIGPLRARFQGVLRIAEADPPKTCVMHFEGQGGAVGFGKGTSSVALREIPEGTELSYEAKAQIGGKLAQVGSRLIDSVVKKMADDFFKAFRLQLVPEAAGAPAVADAGTRPADGGAAQTPARSEAVRPSPAQPVVHAPATPSPPPASAGPTAIMVPGWWLAPAAVLGGALAIAGALLIH